MAKPSPSPYRKPWEPLLLRLLPEQRQRLDRAADHLGKNMTNFIRDAAMEKAIEVEEEIRVAQRHAKEMKERGSFASKSIGLPAWAKTTVREEESEFAAPPPPPPPAIVINNAPQNSDRLVAWVSAAAHSVERTERQHLATRILKESTSDENEQAMMVRSFEEKLGSGQPPSAGRRLMSWLTK